MIYIVKYLYCIYKNTKLLSDYYTKLFYTKIIKYQEDVSDFLLINNFIENSINIYILFLVKIYICYTNYESYIHIMKAIHNIPNLWYIDNISSYNFG